MNAEDIRSLTENLSVLPDPSGLVIIGETLLSVDRMALASTPSVVIRLHKKASDQECEALRALITLYRHWPAIKEALEAKDPAPANLY